MTVAHLVRSIIDENYIFQEPFIRGILHYERFIEYIKKDIEKKMGHEVTKSAIRQALKNYSIKIRKKNYLIFDQTFKSISLKTDICYLAVEESVASADKLQKINHEINNQKGGILNIFYGNYEIGIITNQDNKEKVKDELYDEVVVKEVDDVALLSLSYSQKKTHTLGLLYQVSRYLAFENIDIFTLQNTPSEISLVIQNEDSSKCITILNKMKSDQKKDKDMFNKTVTQLKNRP